MAAANVCSCGDGTAATGADCANNGAETCASCNDGFYVTDMLGMGVNGVTGDYSRGAAGFWIEQGELSFAVSEVTIAGSLPEMFRQIIAANDLEHRTGIDAPTLRIDGLTIAGE